jgi:RNA polymerase sigma-70 factor (ECF subfamily)
MVSNEPQAQQTADDRDTATFNALFRAHAQAVFAICLANNHNYHDAEDIMQSVFLKAIAKVSNVRKPAQVRSWLLQVARRMCVDFHRRRKPTKPLESEPPNPTVHIAVPCERLHAAIQRLPQNYREIIVLYYLDGRKCSSVADSLGIAEPAVRQRLVRARAMLHDLLQEERT